MLLNLEDSNYIDSSGVGWLLRCNKRFREAGGRLVLHSVPPLALQVFQVLKLDKLFHVAADAETARQSALHEGEQA